MIAHIEAAEILEFEENEFRREILENRINNVMEEMEVEIEIDEINHKGGNIFELKLAVDERELEKNYSNSTANEKAKEFIIEVVEKIIEKDVRVRFDDGSEQIACGREISDWYTADFDDFDDSDDSDDDDSDGFEDFEDFLE